MSATLKTPNYELPYYKGSDATNWVDYNNAVLKIDEVMKENSDTGTTQESQITELTTQYQNLSEQQQTMLETLTGNTADLGSLTTRQENLETHMNDVDTQIESLKTEFSGAEGNIQNIETNVTSLQASVSKNSSDITNIFTLTNEHGTDIGNLKITSADLEELMQEHHTSITALNTGLQNLNTSTTQKIGQIQTEVTELSGDVAAAQADITRNTNNIAQLKKGVEFVNSSISTIHYTENAADTPISSSALIPFQMFALGIELNNSQFGICDLILFGGTSTPTTHYTTPVVYTSRQNRIFIPFVYFDNLPRSITMAFYNLDGTPKNIGTSFVRSIKLYRLN